MISVVSQQFSIHPQTLRLYEREGLLKPSRTDGNTRFYTDKDLERLEVILSLTRDLGVNLAGVEIILNMREQMEAMHKQMAEFVACLSQKVEEGLGLATEASSSQLVPVAPRIVPLDSRRAKTPSRPRS